MTRLFDQASDLSEKEENIISLLSRSAFSSWEEMVSGFLSKSEREIMVKGKKQSKNFSELLTLLSDTDKSTRDVAANAFNTILDSQKEIAEAK